jgi:hypothetical protein
VGSGEVNGEKAVNRRETRKDPGEGRCFILYRSLGCETEDNSLWLSSE